MRDDSQFRPSQSIGTILLVEDNLCILEANIQVLSDDGYIVLSAMTLAKAREHLKNASPDVVVLDIVLPDGNGLNFLRELRRYSDVPVMFLTVRDKPDERLAGLLAGGIDYITKPYDINEFRIRVRNIISLVRDRQSSSANLKLGQLMLDVVAQQAFLDGENMYLSPKEFSLLHLFVKNEDKILSVDYLYEKVWGQTLYGESHPVKKTVSRLRARLEESEFIISTHRGSGYCFFIE